MGDDSIDPVTKLLEGETRVVEISRLTPNPDNPKDISKGQLERLRKSMGVLGYLIPILVNKNYQIIDGHQRVKALKEDGFERVEVRIVDLDSDSELLALLATDQTYGSFDRAKRQDLYNLLEKRNARLDILSDYRLQKEGDTGYDVGKQGEPVDNPDKTQYGDIIHLGNHVLICGDSTDPTIWEKVKEQGPYRTLCTSPPYYNQREEYASWESIEDYLADMETVFKLATNDTEDLLAFVNIGMDLEYNLPAKFDTILENCGLNYVDCICWFKPNLNMNIPRFKQIRAQKLYYPAFQWEPCLVYRKGEMPRFDPLHTNSIHEESLSNVWKITTVRDEKRDHPAPYPVTLAKYAVRCYSGVGETVLDPFIGSGTTMFACEDLGKKCIGIEISPEYCDLIIKKWNDKYGS